MTERGLSRAQAAAMLGVSGPTLDRMVRREEVRPPRQVSPGRVVFLESELVDYLRSRPAEPLRAKVAAALAARQAKAA